MFFADVEIYILRSPDPHVQLQAFGNFKKAYDFFQQSQIIYIFSPVIDKFTNLFTGDEKYAQEFVDQINEEDQVFDTNGVKIIIDPKSLVYLDGTELDYAREGLNEGFKFNNPNVKDECGCGESFNV